MEFCQISDFLGQFRNNYSLKTLQILSFVKPFSQNIFLRLSLLLNSNPKNNGNILSQ